MSSSHFQSSAASNAAETTGTWETIMEARRTTNRFPYIPVKDIPEMIRQWHPFNGEWVPPGFIEGHDPPFFRQTRYLDLVLVRKDIARRMAAETDLPYRLNFENGKIDLAPDEQVAPPAASGPLKRKRSPLLPLAGPSSLRQTTPQPGRRNSMDCLYPSPQNVEYMEYMSRQAGGSPIGSPGFGLRLPSAPSQVCEAQIEREPRALCQAPGPGSSQTRTQRGSKERCDSVSVARPGQQGVGAQAPQTRPPRPPVPIYPWK